MGAELGAQRPARACCARRPRLEGDTPAKSLQIKAQHQLGTSGTGNHFVEWGTFRLYADDAQLGLEAGEYLALLSHSGSRGVGFKIANPIAQLAASGMRGSTTSLRHLAWLRSPASRARSTGSRWSWPAASPRPTTP